MDGKSHACGLDRKGSGWVHCVVDDRRRECRVEVKGDTWELDRVRHSYTQASGQSDQNELHSSCQYVLQEQL